ncbi:MAG TPA: hypothetical protein VIH35_08115, partial [Kiritimatiellia bacterium]
MNSGRNKGFEDSTSSITSWGTWQTTNYVRNSTAALVRLAGWQFSGSNMVMLRGDAGMWSDAEIVPFGRYTASTYLRNNASDPLINGSYASIAIEWYGLSNNYLGASESVPLTTSTPGDSWVKYAVDDIAPSNAGVMRRVIRVGMTNLVQNPGLTGAGLAPTSWQNWNDATHDANPVEKLGTSGTSWMFWYDGGLYQDITTGFAPGERVNFGGWLYTPSSDPLVNGSKKGIIQLEFYNGAALISSTQASPGVEWTTTDDVWSNATGTAIVPAGANKIRVLVQTLNPTNGTGRFFADDVFVRNASRAGGSVYVDNLQENPAMVVKNHGAGKSAIFLYSAGDNLPDSGDDADQEPDTHPWKYRYDLFASVLRDYFGVQPAITVLGTNNPYCLPEYRTTSNNCILIQIKNYLYDTAQTNGGSPQTFNISSSLLTGKTVRAFDQGRILEENSDGVVWITLPPDGQEIIYAYPSGAVLPPGASTNQTVQISDSPAVIHPFGDKVYTLKIKYDCRDVTGLKLYCAFMENGNNGDAVSNEVYQILTNSVTANGEQWFFMWIPDPNPLDTDYKSTPDGGKYHFQAWLANTSGVKVAQAVPQPTILEWGVRVTNALPANLTKGQAVTMNTEWEEAYEQLYWQNTPMARNDAYAGRVAVYRSNKTEAQFAGHLGKVNEVCNWLESMGYQAANPLDVAFDNIVVSNLFNETFNSGTFSSWTRVAGANNWAIQKRNQADEPGSELEFNTSAGFSVSPNYQLDLRVVSDSSRYLDKIDLLVARIGVAPQYALSVFADSNGVRSGTALAKTNFTAASTAYTWQSIDMPDIPLEKGKTYHIVASYQSGVWNATNYLRA